MNDIQILSSNKVQFDKNKLIIDESTTYDQWIEIGRNLNHFDRGIQFCIGDWARFGEKKGFSNYTDSKVYDELEALTGLARNTLKQFKSVADSTSCTRVHDLSYGHHREVAKLPPKEQEQFLKKASKEKLSVKQLRDMVKRKSEKPDELDALSADGNLTLASILTIKPKLSKKEMMVQDWIDKVPGNYDEIDMDILNVLIPLMKSLKDKYGIQAIVQLKELSSIIKLRDL
jgi:hypothetical protein